MMKSFIIMIRYEINISSLTAYFIIGNATFVYLQLFGPDFHRSGWHSSNVIIFQVTERKDYLDINVVCRFMIFTGSYDKEATVQWWSCSTRPSHKLIPSSVGKALQKKILESNHYKNLQIQSKTALGLNLERETMEIVLFQCRGDLPWSPMISALLRFLVLLPENY
jgi:hypothetical protein